MFKLLCVCLVAAAVAQDAARNEAGSTSTKAHKNDGGSELTTSSDHLCKNARNCFDHETGKNFQGCTTDLQIGEVGSRGGGSGNWCEIIKCVADPVTKVAKTVRAYPDDPEPVCHGSPRDWLDCEGETNIQCAETWRTGYCKKMVSCAWVAGSDTTHVGQYTAQDKSTSDLNSNNFRMVTTFSPLLKAKAVPVHQCLVVPGQQTNAKGVKCECFCKKA
jgi:hypothetical protein